MKRHRLTAFLVLPFLSGCPLSSHVVIEQTTQCLDAGYDVELVRREDGHVTQVICVRRPEPTAEAR